MCTDLRVERGFGIKRMDVDLFDSDRGYKVGCQHALGLEEHHEKKHLA